jgi:hypothetical protein
VFYERRSQRIEENVTVSGYEIVMQRYWPCGLFDVNYH